MVVVWSNSSKAELKKAYEYIALDSLQNAQMVKDTLIDLTVELYKHPDKHPIDKFKKIMMGLGEHLKNLIIVYLIEYWRMKFE